jgi:hypothetical protein
MSDKQCFESGSAFEGRLDPDPDPYSELGARRPKKAKMKGKARAKRQIVFVSHLSFFNVLPGSGFAWICINFHSWIRIRIHSKSWIRIRTKSMRIRNTTGKGILESRGHFLTSEELPVAHYGNPRCTFLYKELVLCIFESRERNFRKEQNLYLDRSPAA